MKPVKKIVISASRRTDIPAFYMNDFMKGIRQGFFRVVNPFNQKESLIVSSSDYIDTIVFWSKDYTKFIKCNYLKILREMGYHLFFNYTINSEDSFLEPGIPSLDKRLAQLENLSRTAGPESIFWRFDPICYYRRNGKIFHNRHDFLKIADVAADLGIKNCITSFMDLYPKIEKRLSNLSNFSFFDPPIELKVKILYEMADELKKRNIYLMTCCEKKVMESVAPCIGVNPASCIPNHYLKKLYHSDISLRKDRGQRLNQGCGCGISVDVGSYRHQPCFHNCLFCYANAMEPVKGLNNEN